jgi:hypothetical protein
MKGGSMGLGDLGCAEWPVPPSHKWKASYWPIGGSVGLASPNANYGDSNCPGMFVVEITGPIPLPKMRHYAYVTDPITTKSQCQSTVIEIAGYSYLVAAPIDEFWRLDGVTKRHGVWDGSCHFEYLPGYEDIWIRPPRPEDKGTDAGSVEIGAAAATAYIRPIRTVARAYRTFFGIPLRRNVWVGVHPLS